MRRCAAPILRSSNHHLSLTTCPKLVRSMMSLRSRTHHRVVPLDLRRYIAYSLELLNTTNGTLLFAEKRPANCLVLAPPSAQSRVLVTNGTQIWAEQCNPPPTNRRGPAPLKRKGHVCHTRLSSSGMANDQLSEAVLSQDKLSTHKDG